MANKEGNVETNSGGPHSDPLNSDEARKEADPALGVGTTDSIDDNKAKAEAWPEPKPAADPRADDRL